MPINGGKDSIMSKKINQKSTKNQPKITFEMLKRNCEQWAREPIEDEKPLYELAKASTLSVLKKIADITANKTISDIKLNLVKDIKKLNILTNINNTMYSGHYNSNGDYIIDVIDPVAIDVYLDETINIDLVHDAAVMILEQIKKVKDINNGNLPLNFLDIPYKKHKLEKQVSLYGEKKPQYIETETVPIVEIYRYIRSRINDSKSVKIDPKNGYLYIEDIAKNPFTDEEDIFYKRTLRYADLGGESNVINAHQQSYIADENVIDNFYKLVKKINLTTLEAKTLIYKLQGDSNADVAAKMGVKESTIYCRLENIGKKLDNTYQLPNYLFEKKENKLSLTKKECEIIKQMYNDGRSINYIAIHFNRSKSTIWKILNK